MAGRRDRVESNALQIRVIGRLVFQGANMGPDDGPGQVFRYCPKCSAAAIQAVGHKLLRCDACGFELYLNAAAAVAALIPDEQGRLLLVVRGREPQKGMWDLPGGFVDPGESAAEALQREIREELGVNVTSMEYLHSYPNVYEYMGVRYVTVDLGFVCRVDDLSGVHPAEAEVARLVRERPEEIDVHRFAFPSSGQFVQRYLQRRDT
jgi:NAD+ diphosphatase